MLSPLHLTAAFTPRAPLRVDEIGNFDIVVLKITAAGSLVWQRTYSAGEVVDPRGRMAAGPDGSIVIAGAIQAARHQFVDIAALIVKLTSDGALVFDKQFAGRVSETGDGVAVAPDNTIYVAGTTTSFGAGDQDAFVLHLQPTGKKFLDAFTWGGPGFETGAGVAVSGGTLMLAATTNDGATVFVARCFREIIGAERHSCGRRGRARRCRRRRGESCCGHDNAGRKHDVQRKLRGGARKNRAITTLCGFGVRYSQLERQRFLLRS